MTHNTLVLDTFCEVYDLLKPWANEIFWDLSQHTFIHGATYLIGRSQVKEHANLVRELSEVANVIFSNPHEGSSTLASHCMQYGINDLVVNKKIKLIGGGDMGPEYDCLQYDSFLPKVFDYEENIKAAKLIDSLYVKNKPYKFLFLNGRIRSHRKYLIERFRIDNLLDQCLWTNLDSNPGPTSELKLYHNSTNLMLTPSQTQSLPSEYEVDRYQSYINNKVDFHYKKYALFNNEWGEIYLKPKPYQDTYFSLVTETVYSYPYSFRTEKIWKPIAIGHPFIVVANAGYYRDLHNLGFKTFGHIIDESFDHLDNNQDRIERIVDVVKDLCSQDLDQFIKECYNICKYNQQHLAEMSIKVRQEFPDRFLNFIKLHNA